MEVINCFISEHTNLVMWYMLSTTFIITMLMTIGIKKKHKYRIWKKDSVNFLGFKREWEISEDIFINELFSENERLTEENKALKKQTYQLAILTFIVFVVLIVSNYFRNIIKKI